MGPDGPITTVAGVQPETVDATADVETGPEIGFPRALAARPGGELFVADSSRDSNQWIDGGGTIAEFVGLGRPDVDRPGGAAINSDGNVLLADTSGNRIIKIDSDGVAVTAAGTGEPGDSADGEPATDADFSFPSDFAHGTDGTTYVADTLNHRVRVLTLEFPPPTTSSVLKRGELRRQRGARIGSGDSRRGLFLP